MLKNKNNKFSEKEALKKLKDILPTHLKIEGFIDYIGAFSRCIITCKEHGKGVQWGTPWTPRLSDLKSGYGCPI